MGMKNYHYFQLFRRKGYVQWCIPSIFDRLEANLELFKLTNNQVILLLTIAQNAESDDGCRNDGKAVYIGLVVSTRLV